MFASPFCFPTTLCDPKRPCEVDGNMPELVRSIANRLRVFVGNRRRARRYRAQLHATIALFEPKTGIETPVTSRLPTLVGETCDLSETGLALHVPAIRIGERYLTGANIQLLITLELPSGTIRLRAAAARYEQLEKEGEKASYLIGARIVELSDDDRRLFVEHLQTLKNSRQ